MQNKSHEILKYCVVNIGMKWMNERTNGKRNESFHLKVYHESHDEIYMIEFLLNSWKGELKGVNNNMHSRIEWKLVEQLVCKLVLFNKYYSWVCLNQRLQNIEAKPINCQHTNYPKFWLVSSIVYFEVAYSLNYILGI